MSIPCCLREDLLTQAANEGKESERKVQADHFFTVYILGFLMFFGCVKQEAAQRRSADTSYTSEEALIRLNASQEACEGSFAGVTQGAAARTEASPGNGNYVECLCGRRSTLQL